MEVTASHADWREQLDLSTPHPIPGPDAPIYNQMLAPNQWPKPELLPSFRPTYEEYIRQMSDVSTLFTSLIAESLGMPANAFDRFFDEDQQHKLKIVKYPDNGTGVGQGVGPHKDSMLSSYLLQASEVKGLQAQNTQGEWIDCPPIRGTLVVAIGQGLEALTDGVCPATTHRVISPKAGQGPRFSIPFFQCVSYDATFESMDVPEHVRALRKEILDREGTREAVDFTFVKGRWNHLGEATMTNRLISHPDVAERWYPDMLAKIRQQQAADAAQKASKPTQLASQSAVAPVGV
jgi:isopenicillin N synthase-like dioxygenase